MRHNVCLYESILTTVHGGLLRQRDDRISAGRVLVNRRIFVPSSVTRTKNGNERFRTLTSSYYRGAQGIICVYDCTVRESFENLSFWLEEVRKYSTNQDAIKMLVANKVDKQQPGQGVTRSEGEDFAFSNQMLFIETSALTRQGVKQAFEELMLKVLDTGTLLQNTSPIGDGAGGRKSRARCV